MLEVGCGNGVTTSLLSQSATRAIGVDMSVALIEEAKARFPSLEWHAMDARIAGPLAKLAHFNAIFIDLNGSREMETLLPMIDAYEAVLRPALIVVKSNKLKHLISKCSSVDQLLTSSYRRGHESSTKRLRLPRGPLAAVAATPCRLVDKGDSNAARPRSHQRYKR